MQNDVGVENVVSSVIGVGLCFHSRSCKLFSIMYGRLMVCSQKSVLQKLKNGNATKISPLPPLPTQCFKLEFSADWGREVYKGEVL